jgi:hypothetical protein
VNVLHVQDQLNSIASSMGFGRTRHWFEVTVHLFLLPTTAATIMNHPTHLLEMSNGASSSTDT